MTTPNTRLAVTKMVLWALLGAGMAVAAVRFVRGLGETTALTDMTPWGLWIGFDVVSGVALAAGGFVIAAVVHVFHLERYKALLRPAVLTAFLGYVAVVIGLLVDLGRPWNIWRPTVYWQHHSALFEVAWCVMLYLTVLALEFAPVVFEGLRLSRAYRLVTRLTLPLVVVGIALSTLHQSSLGTLLLINPNRVHPLWYSPLLPLLFFVSAVALGLAMVTAESIVSAWLFHRDPEWPQLRGLTRAAAAVLAVYLLVRVGDLAVRGDLRHAVEGTWWAALFAVEIIVSVALPVALFTVPAWRRSRAAVGTGAALVVGGIVLYRANTAGITHIAETGSVYVPALSEVLVSLGVVAGMALVFLFFVEHLRVWDEPATPPDHFRSPLVDGLTGARVRSPWAGAFHLAGAGWLAGAIVGLAVVELGMADRSRPEPFPVRGPRVVAAVQRPVPEPPGHHLAMVSGEPAGTAVVNALLIDGDRTGRWVVFDHDDHQRRLGGVQSCGRCHHRSVPLGRATSCARCHRDMYAATDTFGHDRHVAALGGNASCERCHPPAQPRDRSTATACQTCHRLDRVAGSTVEAAATPGIAPGYEKAMHTLCIGCHREHEERAGVETPVLSRCPNCHRDRLGNGEEIALRAGALVASGRAMP